MKKENMKKEVIVFLLLLGIGVALSILEGFEIHIPNPLEGLIVLLEPITMAIRSFISGSVEG
ncbi:hypothetical protein ACFSCX_07890 [Bacillus salitolerans]|uniref:Holin n=1 Tax=Bacillus salitolerans TaxID=1437434 RepID=A0ABW4LMU2_9BACI